MAIGLFVGIQDPSGVFTQQVDPTFDAARVSIRPLEYQFSGSIFGHYRAVSFSGAVNTISAAGALASLRWADASRYLILTRLAACVEVTGAITTATPIDVSAYVFRGSTASASGSGSSTLTMTGNNQKTRGNMGSSLLSGSSGEIRTIGTTTALTGATGRTLDGAPFGATFLNVIKATNGTGTAVAVPIGGTGGPWQDLYAVSSPYQHPIVLSANEGVEIQVITANPTSGSIKYGFLWEWSECSAF